MTLTLMPSLDESVLRVPAISADLLPPEVVAARRARGSRRRVAAALAAVTVGIGGWYALEARQTNAAEADLATAQDTVQTLRVQQKQFAKLVTTQNELKVIDNRLKVLMAADLSWAKLLTSLRTAAPAGVKVSGIATALASGTTQGSQDSMPQTSGGAKSIGTVSVTGYGKTNAAVAQYVDALGEVPGLGSPLLSDANKEDGQIRFTIRTEITDSLLGGRYTPSDTEGTQTGTTGATAGTTAEAGSATAADRAGGS